MTRVVQIALPLSWLCASIALFFFAGFRYGEPVWLLDKDVMIVAFGFSLALAIPLGLFGLNHLMGLTSRFMWISIVLLAGALSFAVLAMYYLSDAQVSQLVLAYELLLLFAILFLNMLRLNAWIKVAVNVTLFAIAIAPSLTTPSVSSFNEMVVGNNVVEFNETTEFVIGSRHDLKVTTHSLFDQRFDSGGSLVLVDEDRFLVGASTGEFFEVLFVDGHASVAETSIKAPLNRDDYRRQAQDPTQYFRLTDVVLEDASGPERQLLVSHHFWNTDEKCLTLRLSEATIDLDDLDGAPPEWRTRFETEPCIAIAGLSNRNGGKMEYLTRDSILMTVGSHGYEDEVKDIADFDKSSYGKVFEIRLDDWSASVFTSGHRNPQGLLITEGAVWSTEHGPQGGDELNRLERGGHYGWPHSTYGTEYGQREWPLNQGPDDHAVGLKPVYAWVPSIGVSDVIQIRGPAFSAWQGDFIVGSLGGANGRNAGRSLYRLKMENSRVILVERMYTGLLVRDLVELDDGRLVLWDGRAFLQVVEPATHVFSACAGCHGINDGGTHGIGPDLLGITGERVASREDFNYSAALRNFGGRWTTERLDAYLEDPRAAIPGTTMRFRGIKDAALRAEIIEYMAKVRPTVTD